MVYGLRGRGSFLTTPEDAKNRVATGRYSMSPPPPPPSETPKPTESTE